MLIKWHYTVLIDKCVFTGPTISAGTVLSCAASCSLLSYTVTLQKPQQTQQECNHKTDFYGYFTSREDTNPACHSSSSPAGQ